MTVKGGTFHPSEAEALEFMEQDLGEKLYRLPVYSSEAMSYYMTLSGIPVSVMKVIKLTSVYIRRIRIRKGKRSNYFKIRECAGRERQLSVAGCLDMLRGIDGHDDVKPYPEGTDEGIYVSEFRSISRYISWKYRLDIEDSEDIVQDAYLHVVYDIRRTDHVLETWIWYSKQRAKDFRHRYRNVFNEDVEVADACESIYGRLPLAYIRSKITRMVFVLRAQGYKEREIAALMGISKGNVESRISRGIKEFKTAMGL